MKNFLFGVVSVMAVIELMALCRMVKEEMKNNDQT